MIHQNELRIGNLVLDNFDRSNPRKLTVITLEDFVAISNRCKDYTPIPLTEEWLVKCGFVDVNNGYRATGSEVVYEKKDSEGLKVELWEGSNGWTIPYYPNVFTSVHQLQNLYFALTGEELKTKV
jgi:hypothetical protein